MDLDPPPVEKPKRFRYRGELRYPLTNKFDRDVCIKVSEDGNCFDIGWSCWEAAENEVYLYDDNLYTWTGKEWTDFHPGPCTDYDGPKSGNSYERRYMGKRIYPTTRPIHDTANPFAKMAEEAMRGYEKPPVLNWGTPNAIEQYDNRVLARYDLEYIGETDTNVRDNPKSLVVQIIYRTGTAIGIRTLSPQIGFVVSYNDVEYVYTGSEKGWVAINNYRKEETEMPVRYDRIYPRLAIKKVIFNAPATIVFWDDGTKTVVKCGENEEYDPEKGLAMAIAKKALGNQGNYYNQFKKWLPNKEEGPTVIVPDIGSPLHEAAKKLAEGVNSALSSLKKDSE
jgi:hypothetical protein